MKSYILFTLALLMLAITSLTAQGSNKEQKLLAAYIYNFGKFISWQQDKLPQATPLNICFYGDQRLQSPSIQLLNQKTVQERLISSSLVKRGEPINHCHILYIAESEEPYISQISQQIAGEAILTVSKVKGFTQSGEVIIQLYYEDNKLRFNINLTAAKKRNLKISSRLLRLAKEVIE